ncbi:MAG: hypothetical protein LUE25_04500 [Clostridiales bacterium]|nr:hypothetical protein [Clostridiales bacterium]
MKNFFAILIAFSLLISCVSCGSSDDNEDDTDSTASETVTSNTSETETEADTESETDDSTEDGTVSTATIVSDKEYIESTLNLANNTEYTWSYSSSADAWVMSIVSAVAYPEIEDEEGVSVCVPGAYVTGIDTDGDGEADVTSDSYSAAVNGTLVIDYDAEVTSTNGQVYTASTAPVILNTGAAEGDISMFSSLNLQISMLNAGIDANIEWQWDGGHVPSEILSESFALYVDQMYGEYVNGNTIETPEAETQTENGSASSATGTDLSSWVDYDDVSNVSFTLADAVSYRTSGASKAMPGFDVIDYGQEDYVFGSSTQDARHWNVFLLEIFEEYADTLSELFNAG